MKNNPIFTVVVAAIVAAVVGFGTVKYTGASSPSSAQTAAQKGTLEKALASGIIRCGYVPNPPALIKDPNSGKISGIFPEILERAAKNLGLKVEWAEEVGWGTMIEGLQAGRYDMIGSSVWPIGERVRSADFTVPLYYGGMEAYVRTDDSRFDAGLTVLNSPEFRIATIDGEAAAAVAQEDYPKAKQVSLPQLSDVSQMLLNLADGKADVTFTDPVLGYAFMQKNPGRIKQLRLSSPVRLYPNTYMVKQRDDTFRRALNTALTELENNGVVDQIINRYEPFPSAYYRNAKPIRSVLLK